MTLEAKLRRNGLVLGQLKKRTAPGATPPEPEPPERSSESSASEAPAGATEAPAGGLAAVESLMDLRSLSELFRKLQEEAPGL